MTGVQVRLIAGQWLEDGGAGPVRALTGSAILAALDNALDNRAIQRDFASDPVSWAARTYLSLETLSL